MVTGRQKAFFFINILKYLKAGCLLNLLCCHALRRLLGSVLQKAIALEKLSRDAIQGPEQIKAKR